MKTFRTFKNLFNANGDGSSLTDATTNVYVYAPMVIHDIEHLSVAFEAERGSADLTGTFVFYWSAMPVNEALVALTNGSSRDGLVAQSLGQLGRKYDAASITVASADQPAALGASQKTHGVISLENAGYTALVLEFVCSIGDGILRAWAHGKG